VVIGVIMLVKSDKTNIAEENTFGGMGGASVDIIGTKTGTTTEPVGFGIAGTGGQSATTTYVKYIGKTIDEVIYALKIDKASSTSNLHFSVLGSNDTGCSVTATSSTDAAYDADLPVTGDINWFDIGDHLLNKVHSTGFVYGTSTFVWTNPAAGSGKPFILSGLNYDCLALQVSGSSTTIWGQIKTKVK